MRKWMRRGRAAWILMVTCGAATMTGAARGAEMAAPPAGGADDIAAQSDEFGDAASIGNWQQLYQLEKWPNNQLEKYDIDTSAKGCMVMMPYTSVWYREYRGVLVCKPIAGDFVMTTRVYVTGRDGRQPPRSQFSLAGIMVRAPRDVTPQTRQPRGENYIFLSLGAATRPGTYQFETKTTVNSESQLGISDAGGAEALLRVARRGPAVVLLAKTPQGAWRVLQRYHRPDLPATLQAGLTSYTDWPTCEKIPVEKHNTEVIRGGNPDVVAWFDYVRYRRPPAALQTRDIADPNDIADAELVRLLGEDVGG